MKFNIILNFSYFSKFTYLIVQPHFPSLSLTAVLFCFVCLDFSHHKKYFVFLSPSSIHLTFDLICAPFILSIIEFVAFLWFSLLNLLFHCIFWQIMFFSSRLLQWVWLKSFSSRYNSIIINFIYFLYSFTFLQCS